MPILAVGRQGEKVRVVLTTSSYHAATIEAVAVGIDKEGRKRYFYRFKNDVWYELPEGVEAMGNQTDALTRLTHIAADPKRYPYGSMIYLPTPWAKNLRMVSPWTVISG